MDRRRLLGILGFGVMAELSDNRPAEPTQVPPLAVRIVPTSFQEKTGRAIELYRPSQHFHVVVTNVSDESIRLFLARDLEPVPEQERHTRTDEEADLEVARIDLDEAVAMVFRGEITNAAAVGGLLAAARARDEGWATLRPV